jgi:hypothetical protein
MPLLDIKNESPTPNFLDRRASWKNFRKIKPIQLGELQGVNLWLNNKMPKNFLAVC